MSSSSYRPRNPGHDYYGRGTYLITLVVSGREHLLAHFVKGQRSDGVSGGSHADGGTASAPAVREAVIPTALGDTILHIW